MSLEQSPQLRQAVSRTDMEPTLSQSRKDLLGKLLRGGRMASAKPAGIPRRPEGVDIPLSYGQQQVWLHSQISSKVPIYNEPVTIHRLGPIDRDAFERSFTEIVRRHEAWRTTFDWKGRDLVQIVHPAPERIEIPYLDLTGMPEAQRQKEAERVATEDALQPFDLVSGPMYRLRLVRLADEEHRLYLTMHHIIFDGVSLYRVFLPEFQALYDAFSQGLESPLPAPPLQYGDYAIWQREWVEEIVPGQLAYWKKRLEGSLDNHILKTDHPRATTQSYRGAMEVLALDEQLSNAIKEVSNRSGVTLFNTLLAIFQVLILGYSGVDDQVIGSSTAGRNRTEFDSMLGFFLNMIVLRTNLSGDPSFLEVLQRSREELLNALANDGLPFQRLVSELNVARDAGKNPLFQVLFSLEPPIAPLGAGWKFTQMDVETDAAKFDLHLELDERHDGIIGRFIYNTDLFERRTIVKMLENWRYVVQRVVDDPSRRISETLPSAEELARIDYSATAEDAEDLQLVEVAASAGGSGLGGALRRFFWGKQARPSGSFSGRS